MKRWLRGVCLGFVLLYVVFSFGCAKEVSSPVSFDILDIGKADCIVINTGNHIVMIDTGESQDVTSICAYMREKQYEKIDVLILTHPDKDHIGAADTIVKLYPVTELIETPNVIDNEDYQAYHESMDMVGLTATAPRQAYTFVLDDCVFTVNPPQAQEYQSKNENNSSLIVSMEVGKKRFLFCADAMEQRMSEWLGENHGQYDFVKLPYHGNYLACYRTFLQKTNPKYAAITCSKKNPAATSALSMLGEMGVQVYQTTNGRIHVFCDGKTLTVENEA